VAPPPTPLRSRQPSASWAHSSAQPSSRPIRVDCPGRANRKAEVVFLLPGDIRWTRIRRKPRKIVVLRSSRPRRDAVDVANSSSPEPAGAELEPYCAGSCRLLCLPARRAGQATTIYACLRRIVEMGGRHIITSKTVEQNRARTDETEVKTARRLTSPRPRGRHMLRQDPQVIVTAKCARC